MQPMIRYRSQLLARRNFKPKRLIRIKPAAKLNFVFRPVRFGLKPEMKSVP
jgi:hypothetical protein